MQSFGWNLLQFARSVDSLNQEIIEDMKEVICAYFLRKEGLGACYFCVHRTGAMFEGVHALKTVWSSEKNSEAHVVRRYKDKQSSESPSLRALAYNESRCLWITSSVTDADGICTTLDCSGTDNLVDQWREHAGQKALTLPPYVSLHDGVCRTLVALPLKHHGEKLGVLVVEFDRHIPITDGARHEAVLVQEALGRILWLQDAAKSQQEGTRKAFEELKSIVNASTSSVDPPTIFFAFPANSDVAVTDAIKKIITNTYHDRLILITWDQMTAPGQITDQVVKEISRCRYGICYLSEKGDCSEAESIEQRYVDNSNVLIEAGMLHALRSSRLASTVAWIPIREADDRTDSIPFDFVTERMIQVPRESNGALMVDEFVGKMITGLDAMLSV